MGCERYEPHLTAYVDNELSPEAHALIERHLKDCPACRAIVRQLKATGSVMQQWQPAQVSDDFLDKIRKRIKHERQRARRTTPDTPTTSRRTPTSRTVVVKTPGTVVRRRSFTKMALAASVLLAAGIGFLLFKPFGPHTGPARPITVAMVGELTRSAQDVNELGQLATATDVFVAQQLRKENPKPEDVIPTETVQLFIEMASLPSQQKHLAVLLGSPDDSILKAQITPLDRLRYELAAWLTSPEAACYAQMTSPRTAAALSAALKLERRGRYEEAIRAYTEITGDRHDNVVALVRKGGLLLKLGRYKEAQEALAKADVVAAQTTFQRTVTDSLKQRALLAQQLAPKTDALNRRLQSDPDDADAWRKLADMHLQSGNYAGAAEAFDELAQRDKPDRRQMVRFRAASCVKNTGAYEDALGRIAKLRAEGRLDNDVRMLCMFENADILYRCGRYAQSVDAHKVLIGYPDHIDDASRALLILRVGYVQLYDLADRDAARTTLTKLTDARYQNTPAATVARMILDEELS